MIETANVLGAHEFALSTGELLVLCRYLTKRTVNGPISLKADYPTQPDGILLTPFFAQSLFVIDKTFQTAMRGIIYHEDGTGTPCSVRLLSMRYLDLPGDTGASERFWHRDHVTFPRGRLSFLEHQPLPAFLHPYCFPPVRPSPLPDYVPEGSHDADR